MSILQEVRARLHDILSLGEDMAPGQETIASIEDSVEFRGAKLWVLIIAIFVASLGLNTNSAAVIIGAMLISPLMGPIICMGMAVGINDFMLFKRAGKNYLVATAFSVATATVYFMLTPLDGVQSELLARTSPTIYDVGIALCGGLAGIVALSSRSQRMGNVIPGVAIATALMPPLCTVGFGLGTGNWLFALGALYLYLINTIFISLATFIGVTFVVRYPKKVFVDKAREKRVKQIITFISLVTIIPSIFITWQIFQETVFTNRCYEFCKAEVQDNEARIISQDFDYSRKTIRIVMLGESLDSAQISEIQARLPRYGLDEVTLDIVQGNKGLDEESIKGMIYTEKNKTLAAQRQLAEVEMDVRVLRDSLAQYTAAKEFSRTLLPELTALFPGVTSVVTGRGLRAYWKDSVMLDSVAHVVDVELSSSMKADDEERMKAWLSTRLALRNVRVRIHYKE